MFLIYNLNRKNWNRYYRKEILHWLIMCSIKFFNPLKKDDCCVWTVICLWPTYYNMQRENIVFLMFWTSWSECFKIWRKDSFLITCKVNICSRLFFLNIHKTFCEKPAAYFWGKVAIFTFFSMDQQRLFVWYMSYIILNS